MPEVNGNNFGDLTLKFKDKKGGDVKVTLSDFDKTGGVQDGKLDSAELEDLKRFLKDHDVDETVVDTFNFNGLDKVQNDGELDELELKIFEQEAKMLVLLNQKIADLSLHGFSNKIIENITKQLNDLYYNFYKNYTLENVAQMSSDFTTQCNALYEQLTGKEYLKRWTSSAIDDIYAEYAEDITDEDAQGRLWQALDAFAKDFMNNYTGEINESKYTQALGDAIKAYLEETPEGNEALEDAMATFEGHSWGAHVDDNELNDYLKSYAEDIINAALATGMIKFEPSNIISKINSFTDGDKLLELVNNIVDQIRKSYQTRLTLITNGNTEIKIKVNFSTGTVTGTSPLPPLSPEEVNRILDDEVGAFVETLGLDGDLKQNVFSVLIGKATKYLEANPGDLRDEDYVKDIVNYLTNYYNKPLEELKGQTNDWQTSLNGIGSYGDSNLNELKALFKEIFQAAYKAGVRFYVDGQTNRIGEDYVDKFTTADIEDLKRLVRDMIAFIKDSNVTLKDGTFANGIFKFRIDLTGVNAGAAHPTLSTEDAQKIVDEVMKGLNLGGIDQEIRNLVSARLLELALEYAAAHDISAGDFETNLKVFLTNVFDRPLYSINGSITDIYDDIENINVKDGCTDEEFAALISALENMLTTAGKYVVFLDESGNEIDLKKLKESFNKGNADSLVDLLHKLKLAILRYKELNLAGLFEANEDGKVRLYIQGTNVTANAPEAPTNENYSEIMNGKFGPYDYDTVYAAIRKEANTWGMTLYNDLFKQAFETVANKLTIVGDLIYCEPNKLAKKVKEEYENLADKKDDEIINAPLDESQFDSGNDNISWWRNRESQKSRFDSSLKPQLRNKARALCNKYGKTFNETIFKQIYESARDYEINLVWFAFSGWNVSEKRLAGMIKSEFIKNYEDAIK